MHCVGCFAEYPEIKSILCLDEWKTIISIIARETRHIKKVKLNFVGGEPLLFQNLEVLLSFAKQFNFTVSLVTNGLLLDRDFIGNMKDSIDWLGISIDSLHTGGLKKLGRHSRNGNTISKEEYRYKCSLIKDAGIKLKINTIVNKLNYYENFAPFIKEAEPDRWKVFQFLHIKGQNDKAKHLAITPIQLQCFVNWHEKLNPIIETNARMKGSYIMIDPKGRLVDNSGSYLIYSRPIQQVGFQKALSEVTFDYEKFRNRKGAYKW